MASFVPLDFAVPAGLETTDFRLRMLTIHDVVKDYEAVMTSREHLRQFSGSGVFGPQSNWPAADLSLEQDLIDLGWHQKEFQRRTSFAYTVMSLDEQRCLGCVYFYPTDCSTDALHYDAQAIAWVRQSDLHLDVPLITAVKQWLSEAWPCLKSVAWPGRDLSWSDW
ncbi:MAG: hypothetical protein WCD18_13830 [Thermosynechococcaceae cyanobacterium]